VSASLAERLRAIAATPTPAALAELLPIAAQVARIELALDDIAADALETTAAVEAFATLVRDARRRGRRCGHLVVVG
jgi:hypothetical protein